MAKPSLNFKVQLLRSIPASALSFGFDLLIYSCTLKILGFNYLAAMAVGFCMGTFLNYYLAITWVFYRGDIADWRLEFLAFFAASVLGLFLNGLAMGLLISVLGFGTLIARPIASLLVFLANFTARRFLVFARRKRPVN